MSLILHLCSFFGTIVLLPFWLLSLLYKYVTIVTAKIVRSDLRPVTNAKCVILSDDDISQNPGNCSIVALITLDGSPSLSETKSIFLQNVIHATIPGTDQIRYPELRELPVSFLGYPFWKFDPNFNLNNHISEDNECPNVTMTRIHEKMLNMPFKEGMSPWQLILFRNEHLGNTRLALRIHHSMGDGRSVVKLVVECLGRKPLASTEAKFIPRGFKQNAKFCLLLPLHLVLFNAYLMKLYFKFTGHPWEHDTFPRNTSPLSIFISEKISLLDVKYIAKAGQVQTSAVIICAITVAIERYFVAKDYRFSGTLPIYLALPREGHPPTFSNHLFIGIPEMPSLSHLSSMERLNVCGRMYKGMRESEHSRTLDCMSGVMATLPRPVRIPVASMRGVATGVSNIAGEQEGFSVGRYPCLNFNMSAGVPQGSIGASFTVLSYQNHFRMSIVANGSIISREDMVLLGNLVQGEFIRLQKSM